jgi:hypothetical protein
MPHCILLYWVHILLFWVCIIVCLLFAVVYVLLYCVYFLLYYVRIIVCLRFSILCCLRFIGLHGVTFQKAVTITVTDTCYPDSSASVRKLQ